MRRFVFISYSRADREYVDGLVTYLAANGIECWIDHRIEYGAQWLEVIKEKINACAAFIVVMTDEGGESSWVRNEIEHARRQGKPILPLWLSGDGFFGLYETNWIDVRGGRHPDQRFIAQLADLTAEPSADAPAPATPAPPTTAHGRRQRWWVTAALAILLIAAVAAVVRSMADRERDATKDSGTQQANESPSTPASGVPPEQAPSGPTIAIGDIGELVSTWSGQCVEVLHGSPLAGAEVNQYTCNDGLNQQLSTTATANGVKITVKRSGLCLAARADLAVVQLPCDDAQSWKLRHRGVGPGGDGRNWDKWEVRNTGFASGKCLELPGSSQVIGTKLRLAECNWDPNTQQWRTLAR